MREAHRPKGEAYRAKPDSHADILFKYNVVATQHVEMCRDINM